jgi:polar amino acid transport system substrate-binding protein
MSRLKSLAALAAVCVLLLGACSSTPAASGAKSWIAGVQKTGTLRVGVAPAPPFLYQDPANASNWKGIFIDPMVEFAKTMNVKIQYVAGDWNTIIAGLQAGQYDVVAGLNARPARAISVTFTEPLMQSKGVYLLDPSKVPARTWDALNDAKYKVCTALGSAEDLALTNMDPKVQIVRLKDDNSCIQALVSGQVDAVKWDWTGAGQVIQANKQFCMLQPNPPQNGEGIAYAIAQGYSYDDIQALNSEVESFQQRGLLTQSYAANGFVNPEPYNCPG